jgi:hypothetical protein
LDSEETSYRVRLGLYKANLKTTSSMVFELWDQEFETITAVKQN